MNKVHGLWRLILKISNLAAMRNYLFHTSYLPQLNSFMLQWVLLILMYFWLDEYAMLILFHISLVY